MVVAIYSGNDPLGAFLPAYGNPLWADDRSNPGLTASAAPAVAFPAPPGQQWQAQFGNGERMIFTPELRHSNSRDQPAVNARWKIMEKAARRLAEYMVGTQSGLRAELRLITREGWWTFADDALILANGWGTRDAGGETSLQAERSDGRVFSTWPYLGRIATIEPHRFGPMAHAPAAPGPGPAGN
ncbi:hypothetical protein [Candidatus Thiodictyon syntrophicum]|uniref:Uncharacterized protein n=1 Tax=Candidatus Thiodictyon syntrophicum TaxID=1166950 RepID=A0A2K8UF02_9GAMM|nr:hypothetical protein [Candidatus Thiodictyon syntrophicum]AUB84154.1 hypothetical protein THSYN_26590 [Candidatus Thiodictyon syntrophicum]